jgi:hypothetical protein
VHNDGEVADRTCAAFDALPWNAAHSAQCSFMPLSWNALRFSAMFFWAAGADFSGMQDGSTKVEPYR